MGWVDLALWFSVAGCAAQVSILIPREIGIGVVLRPGIWRVIRYPRTVLVAWWRKDH